MKILIFDTETADKAKNFKKNAEEDFYNYPYLIQLSAILVDYDIWYKHFCKNKTNALNKAIVAEINEYIHPSRAAAHGLPAREISITSEAQDVHKICFETLIKEGIHILDALEHFQQLLSKADVIVAHNINFDRNVLVSEAFRIGYELRYKKNAVKFCSMLNTIDVLKLPGKWNNSFKWPSLAELYNYCFKTTFNGAHNSYQDVLATAKCVLYLQKEGKINLK